uniref:SD-repeat containing protein B domain-containing protein n=1 Tax=Candidatus Enterococcus mansonii TaxID=1834181 RepID=A0A242CHW1_9ENTE|nr:SdrD B-like domain-containing protein [Enterococcus sp. 4G2_DIV0659]OTO09833.1 hypothetical protein A5880_000516 [Enterococcus sp. 4G2_DIV0659]
MKIRKIVSSVVMWGVMLSIFFLNIPAMAQNKVSGTSSISGVFFEDTNINGKKDINEKGLSGISIKLTDENGTEIPGKEVTTRADGKYIFEGLEGRNYALKIEVPKGYRVVTSRYFQMDKNGQTGFVSLEEDDQFEDGWLGFYKER